MIFNFSRKENLTKIIESGTVQLNFTFVRGLSFSAFIHSFRFALRSDPQELRKFPLKPRPVVAAVIVVAASESYKIVYYSKLNG